MPNETQALLHAPPSGGLSYLPSSGDPNRDAPHGIAAADSVHTLDSRIGAINTATMNAEPLRVSSYCDHTCGQGCSETIVKPAALSADALDGAFDDLIERIDCITSTVGEMTGTWGERMQARYGRGGDVDLAALSERTEEVKSAVAPMITSSNTHTDGAHKTLRETVKSIRRWQASDPQPVEQGGGMRGLLGPLAGATMLPFGVPTALMAGALGWLMGDRSNPSADGNNAPSIPELSASGAEHDKSIETLDAALKDWKIGAGDKDGDASATLGGTAKGSTVSNVESAPADEPPLLAGGADGTTEPTDDLGKKIDDLLNKAGDQGLPGGMPGGGMPGGGMPQMPSMPQVPFGGQDMPYSAEASPFDEVPEDDADAEELDGEDLDDGDEDTDADAEELDGIAEDEDVAPDDGGIAPVDAGVPAAAAAAFDPESVEARTVDVGNGRQVAFPTSRLADTVRGLIAAGSDNPKSIYAAASEAGYALPPQGQDIGEMVPPSAMKEGDIIAGADNKNGVYLGQGDVLMEGGEVKRLTDVANFDGEHQGVFRLTEPTPTMAGLDGVAQQVGETPEPTLTGSLLNGGGSEPGVPTDDAVPFSSTSESASSMPGRSTGGGGLDAGSAFAN